MTISVFQPIAARLGLAGLFRIQLGDDILDKLEIGLRGEHYQRVAPLIGRQLDGV